ncbi:MAG: acetyl-CoA carboxylase biotin carboxyl carrier protein [Flammeovirgaceae bacterium]
MKSKEIKELLEFIATTGLAEINIETAEIKMHVKRFAGVQAVTTLEATYPAPTPTFTPSMPVSKPTAIEKAEEAAAEVVQSSSSSDTSRYVTIKSPMIGTFYRSPKPESPAFVNVGDVITKGQKVCIIEAMKLFNEIESEVSGRIVKILVENATPVEYDQPLFLVDPA